MIGFSGHFPNGLLATHPANGKLWEKHSENSGALWIVS